MRVLLKAPHGTHAVRLAFNGQVRPPCQRKRPWTCAIGARARHRTLASTRSAATAAWMASSSSMGARTMRRSMSTDCQWRSCWRGIQRTCSRRRHAEQCWLARQSKQHAELTGQYCPSCSFMVDARSAVCGSRLTLNCQRCDSRVAGGRAHGKRYASFEMQRPSGQFPSACVPAQRTLPPCFLPQAPLPSVGAPTQCRPRSGSTTG